MSPVRLLPDAERLVTTFLRAQPDVAALASTRVTTELPKAPIYPAVTISRVGGVPTLPGYLDVARLEVSAWATTKAAAHTLARTVEAALLAVPGAHALGTVTDARQEDIGLRWNPDEESNVPRYQFIVELYIHPPA
jgi:hypothetical protein